MKKLFIFISIIALAFFAHKIIAQEAAVESDFARDVAAGKQEIQSDPTAAVSQQEVDSAENAVAEINNQEVIPEETVQSDEAVESTTDLLPPNVELTITPEPNPEPTIEPSEETPASEP